MNARPSTLEFKKIDAKLGVEVGVEAGDNAKTMLETMPDLKLIGVDNNEHGCNLQAKTNLSSFNGRFKLYEVDSNYGSRMVLDNTLDFVYIDADHHYDSVLLDLERWYPKVRKGGIVAGHDFEKLGRIDNQNVQEAVLKFVTDRNIQIHTASILGEPGENAYNRMDWWFFKES